MSLTRTFTEPAAKGRGGILAGMDLETVRDVSLPEKSKPVSGSTTAATQRGCGGIRLVSP
jgi:hypothetical protein